MAFADLNYITARNAFNRVFNDRPNFMTPNRLDYGVSANGRKAWELGSGRGLWNQPIFGVTVLTIVPEPAEEDHMLSRLFQSEQDARDYIAAGFKLEE